VSPSLISALAFTAAFGVSALSSLVRLFGPAPVSGGGRMAALSHLLMSVAMVGMAWGWPGPGTSAGVVQLAMFGLLAALFVRRVLHPAGNGRAGNARHLLVLVAMVWMLAAMPWVMGTDPASHDAPVPAWTQVVTLAFLVLLGNAALASVVEEHRGSPVLVAAGSRAGRGARPGHPVGSRLDSAGHVLMSGGMAGMLLTML
jgi:hypothetical protein